MYLRMCICMIVSIAYSKQKCTPHHRNKYTHTYIHTYKRVCVCVCWCVRAFVCVVSMYFDLALCR